MHSRNCLPILLGKYTWKRRAKRDSMENNQKHWNRHIPHVHHNRYFSTTVRPNFSWTSLGVSIWNKQPMSQKICQGKVIWNTCIATPARWATNRIQSFEDSLNCIMRISGTNDLSRQQKLEQTLKLQDHLQFYFWVVSYLRLDILKTS